MSCERHLSKTGFHVKEFRAPRVRDGILVGCIPRCPAFRPRTNLANSLVQLPQGAANGQDEPTETGMHDIDGLVRRRDRARDRFATLGDLRPGTPIESHRKCCKPGCHCAGDGDLGPGPGTSSTGRCAENAAQCASSPTRSTGSGTCSGNSSGSTRSPPSSLGPARPGATRRGKATAKEEGAGGRVRRRDRAADRGCRRRVQLRDGTGRKLGTMTGRCTVGGTGPRISL